MRRLPIFLAPTALAALLIAPTPAAAVINNQGISGCAAPHPGDQVFWNGNTWCQLQEGQGGAPSSAPGASPLDPHFWASSDAPKDPVVECLRQNAGGCMPVQRGGRDVLESKNGTIAGQGGGGSKTAGKSETGRGRVARDLSEAECDKLTKVGALPPPYDRRFSDLERQIAALKKEDQKLTERQNELEAARRQARSWAPGIVALMTPPPQEHLFTQSIVAPMDVQITELTNKRKAARAKIQDLTVEQDRLRIQSEPAVRVALRRCGKLYGAGPGQRSRPAQ
jgi:hypothetical protein